MEVRHRHEFHEEPHQKPDEGCPGEDREHDRGREEEARSRWKANVYRGMNRVESIPNAYPTRNAQIHVLHNEYDLFMWFRALRSRTFPQKRKLRVIGSLWIYIRGKTRNVLPLKQQTRTVENHGVGSPPSRIGIKKDAKAIPSSSCGGARNTPSIGGG